MPDELQLGDYAECHGHLVRLEKWMVRVTLVESGHQQTVPLADCIYVPPPGEQESQVAELREDRRRNPRDGGQPTQDIELPSRCDRRRRGNDSHLR